MAFKSVEKILIYHAESESYMVGTSDDLSNIELSDVTGFVDHEAHAALRGISIKHAMLPHMLAKEGCSEHMEQCALFCCLQIASEYFPQLNAAFAIPNGGSRGDTDLSRKIAGGKMKAEGVKTGVPDVFLPIPVGNYAGLFIELKRANGSLKDLSDKQVEWADNLQSVGYCVCCCMGWKQAMETIISYLQL